MAHGNASATGGQLLEELRRDLADVERADSLPPPFSPPSQSAGCRRGGSGRSLASSSRSSRAIAAASPSLPPATRLAQPETLPVDGRRGRAGALAPRRLRRLARHRPGRPPLLRAAGGSAGSPAFVAWLALNGLRADVALAFLVNLAAWAANCGRVAAALRDRYGAEQEAVAFFDFFATPPPGFEEPARSTPARGYELLFWDTLAEGDS